MRNSNVPPSLGLLFSTAATLVSPAHETITRMPLYCSVPPLSARSPVKAVIRRLLETIDVWRRRMMERRRLALLDDRMLKDIGIDRHDVREELEKPFWKA